MIVALLFVAATFAAHVAPSGSGTKNDPYVVTPGETESLKLAKDASAYLSFNTTGASKFHFVLYPCFGAMDHKVFLDTQDTSGKAAFEKKWPADPTEYHGNHIWDPVQLALSGAEFALVEVVNKFDGESEFVVDNRIDDELWLVPGDGETMVGEVTPTTARIDWTPTDVEGDEYKMIYHIGSADGKMKPGHLMGTACAISKLQELHGSEAHVSDGHNDHDHDDDHDHDHKRNILDENDGHEHDADGSHDEHEHTVVTAFEWTSGKEYHLLEDLVPDTNAYHVDILVRRASSPGHYHVRAYHSNVLPTPKADPESTENNASAIAASAALVIAAFLTLLY